MIPFSATPDEIRRGLPLAYVLETYGHRPARASGNRLHYYSPFRDDDNPSFDVFLSKDNEPRWGDFAEGTQGGVIDLIQRFEGGDNASAIGRARMLYAEYQGSGWSGPTLGERRAFEVAPAESLLEQGSAGPAQATAVLEDLRGKRPGLPSAAEIMAAWGVVSDPGGDGVLVPIRDRNGGLVGIRVRRSSGDKRSVTGSNSGVLYGLWRLHDDDRPVLLCEGETDTWSASSALPDFDVLGVLGSGVLPSPDRIAPLAGRRVYVAFDGDEAGLRGARAWALALLQAGNEVLLVPTPDGRDLSSVDPSAIKALPGRARPIQAPPDGFVALGDSYGRRRKDDYDPVSNWVLDLRRIIRSSAGDLAFEGEMLPHRRTVVLPVEALSSSQALTRWANLNGGVWTGGPADHQRLLHLLLHDGNFLPEGRMTRQVGLHEGDFVWPGGWIGTDSWTYVPPASRISLESRVRITRGPDPDASGARAVDLLASMYGAAAPEVTGPILAWLATAPLRPLFERFPILSVSGASGTGKTTLIETLLDTFSGSRISVNLTSTTPYAVTAFFASANAVPIWFDEYRPGAREDAKAQLDQLLRDCYTGQPSYKGGMTGDKSEVVEIPTMAPIVVTGEDSFDETSHTDRMVLVRLTKAGQRPLARLQAAKADWDHFAYTYLDWLLSGDRFSGTITIRPVGPEHLNERQRINLGVLQFGWRLLAAFVGEMAPHRTLPQLDLTGVVAKAAEAQSSNPVLDAVRWALETGTVSDAVWSEGDYVYVSPTNLLGEARRNGAFKLPASNARGLIALLVDQHGGEQVRRKRSGRFVRVVQVPAHEVVESTP